MWRFCHGFAALLLALAAPNSASAQVKTIVSYPGCKLLIRPGADGAVFRLSDTGDVLVSTAEPWSPANGCEQMFRRALNVDPNIPVICPEATPNEQSCPELQPCVDKAATLLEATAQCNQEKTSAVDAARAGQMLVAQTLVGEKEALVQMLASLDRRNETDGFGSSTVRVIDDRLSFIDRQMREILPAIRAGSIDQGYMQRAHVLEEKNNQLTENRQHLLKTIQDTQGALTGSRLNESILQGWLVDVAIVVVTFIAAALLFWFGLLATKQYVARRIAALGRITGGNDVDMEWLRTTIDEQTWLVTRTRWLPILVGSLFVISAFTVVVNVFTSGASVIDVVRGGALLVTLVAVIKVALDADSWHRDLRKELVSMMEQYRKYGPVNSAEST